MPCPWSEPWTDPDEVALNWEGDATASGGRMSAGSLTRRLGGGFLISSSMGGFPSESPATSTISLLADGSVVIQIRLEWADGDAPTWVVIDAIGSQEIFPSNPDQPQSILVNWNETGDYFIQVNSEIVSGSDPSIGAVDAVEVFSAENGYVGAMSVTCESYAPIPGGAFMITEDGDAMITEDGDRMEVS